MGPPPAIFDRKQTRPLAPPLPPSKFPLGIVLVANPGIWWIDVLNKPMPLSYKLRSDTSTRVVGLPRQHLCAQHQRQPALETLRIASLGK